MITQNCIRILLIAVIIGTNIGCDQSTKYIAKKYLHDKGTIHVIGNYLILHYAENNGAFLSIFSPLPRGLRIILLTILPVIAMTCMLIYVLYNRKLSDLQLFALCCIIGGGASNVFDRVSNNEYVIDFINVGIGAIRSGILNCADLSITLGIILFMYSEMNKRKTIDRQNG